MYDPQASSLLIASSCIKRMYSAISLSQYCRLCDRGLALGLDIQRILADNGSSKLIVSAMAQGLLDGRFRGA
jgi:hypothetical protein